MDGPHASLNFFQRLILQWDKLHPYNAAQVLKLEGPAPAAALSESWQQTLSAMLPGLNGTMQIVPEQELCDFISQEMNRPFDRATTFRAFILDRCLLETKMRKQPAHYRSEGLIRSFHFHSPNFSTSNRVLEIAAKFSESALRDSVQFALR